MKLISVVTPCYNEQANTPVEENSCSHFYAQGV